MADYPYPNARGGAADGGYAEGEGYGVENVHFSDDDDFREAGEDTTDEDELFGDGVEQKDYYAILNVPRNVCMRTSTSKCGA